MKTLFQLVLLAALGFGWALPAQAQNECGTGGAPVRGTNGNDQQGVNHQNACVDTTTGKLFFPNLQSVVACVSNGIASPGCSNFPATMSGIQTALTFATSAPLSVVDARSVQGTLTGPGFAIGCTGGCNTLFLTGFTTFNFTTPVVMNRASRWEASTEQATQVTCATGECITTPAGTTGGVITFRNLAITCNAVGTGACVHLNDCPFCKCENSIVSFETTSTGAGVRYEAVTANAGSGTWRWRLDGCLIQRTSAGQLLGRNATGSIGLDLKGNSGITNGDVSKGVMLNSHIEGQNTNVKIFCGSNNKFIGGDMLNGAPSYAITGNGACNSSANTMDMDLNGTNAAGAQGFTIDANSSFNRIFGSVDQNPVASVDSSGGSSLLCFNTGSNNGVCNYGNNGITDTFFVRPASLTANLPVVPASSLIDWMSNGDNMWDYNSNNQGTQHVPLRGTVASQYTNSTTGFTSIPAFFFNVEANGTYALQCHLYYQSAATGGLNIQFTGPVGATVHYALLLPVTTGTAPISTEADAFSTSLGAVVGTAATNFDAIVSLGMINGVTAGGLQMQAKSSAAAQLQIQTGSYCDIN